MLYSSFSYGREFPGHQNHVDFTAKTIVDNLWDLKNKSNDGT